MQEKLSAHPNADGSAVELAVTQAGGATATVAIPVEQLGHLANGLFAAAIECSARSGKFIDPATAPENATYVRHAHAVGLSLVDDGCGLIVMTFAIGGADFAIGVPIEILKPLGESLREYGTLTKQH